MLRSLLSNHLMGTGYVTRFGKLRRQRCQVVSTSDSQSGGSRFESRPVHLLDLFSVVPSSNPWPRLQIADWFPPSSWVFNPVMLYLNYLFLSI